MARYRVDNFILEVEGPQTNVKTEKTASVTVQEVISCDFKAVKKTMLENQQMGARTAGSLPPIAGLYDGAKASFEMYTEGARTVAADSASFGPTALCHLLSAVSQFSSSVHLRSKVATGASAISFTEGYNTAHSASANGAKERVCLFPVQDLTDGTTEIVAGKYGAAGQINLLTALSFTPAVNDICYAAINHQFVESYSTLPYCLTIRQLGNEQKQNKKVIGAVGTCTIGAIGPNEIPTMNFSFQAASGSVNFADVRPSTNAVKPKCLAGSALKFGVFGQTAMSSPCGRADITLGVESIPERCQNEAIGIQSWLRKEGSCEVKLTVPGDFLPSSMTGGGTETSWTEFLENNNSYGFHLISSYGQNTAGSILAFYFPELILTAVDEDADQDKYSVAVLTLVPKRDSNYPAWIDCIA